VLTSQGDDQPRGGVLLRLGPQPDADVGGGGGRGFVVVAPLAGVIAQVMVRRGERVAAGQQVAVMTRPVSAAEQQALLFVGQEQAARIRPGMVANVAVDVADQDLFGTIRGQVASVSPLPYNDAAVQAAVQSVALARRLPESADGTPYLVTVTLTTAATSSGFAWAHGSGPDARIPDGALGTVTIVADTRAPISYLISQRRER
jgi:HlyD family secretion protein